MNVSMPAWYRTCARQGTTSPIWRRRRPRRATRRLWHGRNARGAFSSPKTKILAIWYFGKADQFQASFCFASIRQCASSREFGSTPRSVDLAKVCLVATQSLKKQGSVRGLCRGKAALSASKSSTRQSAPTTPKSSSNSVSNCRQSGEPIRIRSVERANLTTSQMRRRSLCPLPRPGEGSAGKLSAPCGQGLVKAKSPELSPRALCATCIADQWPVQLKRHTSDEVIVWVSTLLWTMEPPINAGCI